jgi:signal transduction histidine kinase
MVLLEFAVINKILVFAIDLFAVWLISLVFSNNPKGKVNLIFVVMSLCMLLWVNFAWFARLVMYEDISLSLIFLHVAWFVTPYLFTFLYFLIVYLVGKEKEYKLLNALVIFMGVAASITVTFTNLVIAGAKVVNDSLSIIYGDGMMLFLAIVFILILATLYQLIKDYLVGDAGTRKKLVYFLIGTLLFYVLNTVFNIVLPWIFGITKYYFIGDYSTILLLSFTAFAITKTRLFGTRVVITQLLVGVLTALLLLNFGMASSDFDYIFRGVLLIGFVVVGYFLINSTARELEVREQLQEANKKLEIANERLKELDKSKSEFLDIASHQLRTPLTAIKGYISMILEGDFGRISVNIKEKLKNVFESNERLIKLVNNLLNVSRIEAGRIDMNYEKIDLVSLLSNIVDELSVHAKSKNQKIEIKPIGSIPAITLDSAKIRQVFINLIDNAIKYTPAEGQIEIILENKPQILRVLVKDSGIGMSKEEIEELFQIFTRGKSSPQLFSDGVGVGLFVAKKFVEIHKGKIWAESEGKGKGSTFVVELPIT